MKYKIEEQKDKSVKISITDVKNSAEILSSLNDCKEGNCSCKTDEYKKLQDLQITNSTDQITVDLKPAAGKSFNTSEIEKCLDTIEKN